MLGIGPAFDHRHVAGLSAGRGLAVMLSVSLLSCVKVSLLSPCGVHQAGVLGFGSDGSADCGVHLLAPANSHARWLGAYRRRVWRLIGVSGG